MSKYLFLFSILLLFSCTKSRFNRFAEGAWQVETFNGEEIPSADYNLKKSIYTFTTSDQKTGTVTVFQQPEMSSTYTLKGTYKLESNKKIKMNLTDDYMVPVNLEYTIKKISKKTLIFETTEGKEIVLKQ